MADSLKEQFPYRQVADALLDLRATHHLTQTELAQRIGTSQSAISRAESGKHPIAVSLLKRISDALGLDYAIVFTLAPDRGAAETR